MRLLVFWAGLCLCEKPGPVVRTVLCESPEYCSGRGGLCEAPGPSLFISLFCVRVCCIEGQGRSV